MKRVLAFLTVSVVTAFSVTPVFADLLIYEPFDYTSGSPIIGQQNIYSPSSPTWLRAGTVGTGTVHNIASGSLTMPTGLPASIGNSGDTVNADSGEYGKLNLPSEYGANATLYYSLLINVPSTTGLTVANTNPNANNDGIIAFNNNMGSSATRPNTWAGELAMRLGSTSGTFNLGVRASTTTNGAPNTYWSANLTPGQTYFVVVGFTEAATPGSPGVNSLWINPNSSTYNALAAPTPDGSSLGTYSTSGSADHTDSLILGAGIATGADPSSTLVDEIRIGTTWADVVPEPSMLALAGFGSVVFMAWFRNRRR